MKKKLLILFLVLAILMSMYSVTYAFGIDTILEGSENFIKAGQDERFNINTQGIYNTSDLIYNTLLILGIAAIAIVGIVLGIKYVSSSVEEQAKIKETLVPYIVGSVVIFGAFGIWKLVTEILEGLT